MVRVSEGTTGQRPSERKEAGRDGPDSARRTVRSIAALAGLLTLVALVAEVLVVRHLPPPHHDHHNVVVSLAVMTAVFVLTEIGVIHLYVREHAYSYSLAEMTLVVGMLFVSPHELIIARVVGGAVALIIFRRQRGIRLAFNLSIFAIEVCVALTVYRTILQHHAPLAPAGWLAAFAAIVVVDGVTTLAVWVAIGLSIGMANKGALRGVLPTQGAAAVINTSVGLVAGCVLAADLRYGVLVGLVVGVAVAAYRSYSALAQRYQRVELLYGFTRSVGQSLQTAGPGRGQEHGHTCGGCRGRHQPTQTRRGARDRLTADYPAPQFIRSLGGRQVMRQLEIHPLRHSTTASPAPCARDSIGTLRCP